MHLVKLLKNLFYFQYVYALLFDRVHFRILENIGGFLQVILYLFLEDNIFIAMIFVQLLASCFSIFFYELEQYSIVILYKMLYYFI